MICWNFFTPLILFVLVVHSFTQTFAQSDFPAGVQVNIAKYVKKIEELSSKKKRTLFICKKLIEGVISSYESSIYGFKKND